MSFFDSDLVEDVSFKPLDNGWYAAVILTYDFKSNKNRNGMVLEVEFEVKAIHNKRIKCYYNLQHQNPDAQAIGRSYFKQVLMAVDLPKIERQSDLALLVGKRLGVYLGTREYDGKMYNEIKEVKHISHLSNPNTFDQSASAGFSNSGQNNNEPNVNNFIPNEANNYDQTVVPGFNDASQYQNQSNANNFNSNQTAGDSFTTF